MLESVRDLLPSVLSGGHVGAKDDKPGDGGIEDVVDAIVAGDALKATNVALIDVGGPPRGAGWLLEGGVCNHIFLAAAAICFWIDVARPHKEGLGVGVLTVPRVALDDDIAAGFIGVSPLKQRAYTRLGGSDLTQALDALQVRDIF